MSDLIRLPAVAAVLLLAVAPAAAQAPQRGLPSRNLLDRYGLERAWSNQATIDVRSDVVRHLLADEEVVIVQSRSGLVTVFDAQSGVKLWDGRLARADQHSYPAVTNADTLFIVIGSTVYARDKFNGDELWALRLPSVPSTSPTVGNDRMYVGTLEGSVYAYDLEEVEQLQTEGRLQQYLYEATVWRYKTSSEIVAAPVADEKRVVFANKAGALYAVKPILRDLAFQFETDVAASAPLDIVSDAAGEDTIYYAAGDTNFYALRASNGTTRWLYVAGSAIREKPHPIGDSVFLVPLGAGMYDLSAATGRMRWWVPSVRQFVAATPTRVYATDQAGDLAVIDRADGAVLGTLPTLNFPIRVPNERTDRMYLASTSGLVTCLREEGAELPIYHRYPERRPILPLFGGDNAGELTDEGGATAEERAAQEEAAEAVPAAPEPGVPAE
jgi:outer membrane protein assembly factor BamB